MMQAMGGSLVIKPRIPAKTAYQVQSGATIIGFFKGLTTKILIVGQKLIFSFAIAQQLIPPLGYWRDKK